MNKDNCALKLVDEIILYYDARSKKHQSRRVNYLDGGLWQIELRSEFAPSGPRHIIFLEELFLQPRQLFARERRSVAPDVLFCHCR